MSDLTSHFDSPGFNCFENVKNAQCLSMEAFEYFQVLLGGLLYVVAFHSKLLKMFQPGDGGNSRYVRSLKTFSMSTANYIIQVT